jgi:hypothetical protein
LGYVLGVTQKYGIPVADLPSHCLDAIDAAERTRARTIVVRGPLAVAAIVPMSDLERIDPPDPGAAGQDPLLALCGSCRHDNFVDAFGSDLHQTTLWTPSRPPPPPRAGAAHAPPAPPGPPPAPRPSRTPPPKPSAAKR